MWERPRPSLQAHHQLLTPEPGGAEVKDRHLRNHKQAYRQAAQSAREGRQVQAVPGTRHTLCCTGVTWRQERPSSVVSSLLSLKRLHSECWVRAADCHEGRRCVRSINPVFGEKYWRINFYLRPIIFLRLQKRLDIFLAGKLKIWNKQSKQQFSLEWKLPGSAGLICFVDGPSPRPRTGRVWHIISIDKYLSDRWRNEFSSCLCAHPNTFPLFIWKLFYVSCYLSILSRLISQILKNLALEKSLVSTCNAKF